jgi:nitrogen fixation NifU-like protein
MRKISRGNRMTTGWEKFQEMIKEQMRQVYSETFIEHATDPKNMGDMESADSHVSVLGPCSDRMTIWLKIKHNRIAQATFLTNGCSATIACGSMVTELAKGKTLGEALAINADIIAKSLGGLPDEHAHCAGLASLSLKKAIIEYMELQKEP